MTIDRSVEVRDLPGRIDELTRNLLEVLPDTNHPSRKIGVLGNIAPWSFYSAHVPMEHAVTAWLLVTRTKTSFNREVWIAAPSRVFLWQGRLQQGKKLCTELDPTSLPKTDQQHLIDLLSKLYQKTSS